VLIDTAGCDCEEDVAVLREKGTSRCASNYIYRCVFVYIYSLVLIDTSGCDCEEDVAGKGSVQVREQLYI